MYHAVEDLNRSEKIFYIADQCLGQAILFYLVHWVASQVFIWRFRLLFWARNFATLLPNILYFEIVSQLFNLVIYNAFLDFGSKWWAIWSPCFMIAKPFPDQSNMVMPRSSESCERFEETVQSHFLWMSPCSALSWSRLGHFIMLDIYFLSESIWESSS